MPTDTPTPIPTAAPTDTPRPPLSECIPVGGVTEPSVCGASVSVQINEGAPQPVGRDGRITLNAGDTLRLVNLRYCASSEASADRVSGEAYLFKNHVEDYGNGLFPREGVRIHTGCGDIGGFEGSWIMESGQHRVLIVLMHYFGDVYEQDDKFYLNLDVP